MLLRPVSSSGGLSAETDPVFTAALDTDAALTANSDAKVASQKAIKSYVDALINGVLDLQGDWDASTNSPDISGTTTTGYAWRVSVAGSTNLGGITTWAVGDLAVKTATGWLKIANADVAAVWGNISGTLSNQSDLWTILQYLKKQVITFNFNGLYSVDGTQSTILANTKSHVQIPWDFTITGWKILEASGTPITGSFVVDIQKKTSLPMTDSDSIAGSDKPTLVSQTNNSSSALTGWTTTGNANDFIGANVDSNTGCKNVVVEIMIEKR